MVCIVCGNETAVVNSRPQKRSNSIWRRRKCQNCGNIFTSTEKIELSGTIRVRTSADKLVPFSRDILFLSVYESCKHRPSAPRDATTLTQVIIDDLLRGEIQAPISHDEISQAALTVIRRFDPVAATFYSAYHPVP